MYQRDPQKIAGSNERRTVRAFGEDLSTHWIHSPDQISLRLRTAPLRIRLSVLDPNRAVGAGQRIEHSPQVTTSPCGSHLSGIPYMVRRRDATANCTCANRWAGILVKIRYRLNRPPPPSKAGACFYYIACFYSLLAFIFTIHAKLRVPFQFVPPVEAVRPAAATKPKPKAAPKQLSMTAFLKKN